ncbi:MAG TPA: hypothetical protein VMT89_17580, partial [Candidatus Acidoferrales bacterium]|nr:hypothetical protein [Candidatus Acidoferrales bacterium]
MSVLAIWAVGVADATTFVDLDAAGLANRSQGVVYGRVTSVDPVADPTTNGVWTSVTIQPDTVVAGTLPTGPIVLEELGG